MLDFSWSHLLIFALVAIILVPSKDLPALLRNIGKYVGQARKMATEFRGQVDEALRESELAEIQKSVKADMKSIEESASMAETERKLQDAVRSGTIQTPSESAAMAKSPTFPSGANGSIIPSVATSLPVEEATTAAVRDTSAAPARPSEPARITAMPDAGDTTAAAPVLNGARPRSDGIEVVRAGRGSVAQRAAAAWKKTASSQAGSEG